MSTSSFRVSVIDPVTPAIERVKSILFRPFDLGKWIVIGFCAWLASLGRSFGAGPWFQFSNHRNQFNFQSAFEQAKDYILSNLPWIVPLAVVAGLFLLLVWLAITWVSSRGHFLFLDCVATDRTEIAEPWSKWARQSDSLFLFRILLGLVGFGLMLPFVGLGVMNVIHLLGGQVRFGSILFRMIFLVLGAIAAATGLSLVRKLTVDFVVPTMRLRGSTCWAAWQQFLGLASHHVGSFVLYLLFSIVLAIAIRFLILAGIILTCCIAGCLLALPFVSAVVLLPISVFRRSYSLHYLAQFGPEFDVFTSTQI